MYTVANKHAELICNWKGMTVKIKTEKHKQKQQKKGK